MDKENLEISEELLDSLSLDELDELDDELEEIVDKLDDIIDECEEALED